MAQHKRQYIIRGISTAMIVFFFIGTVLSVPNPSRSLAQARMSPTPLRAQIGSTPTQGLRLEVQASPTFTPTATAQQAAFLEAKPEAADGVNVRAEADPEADVLGLIRPGEQYVVTGRYYLWLRFRYDRSPNGQGWVFGDLVNLSGDTTLIPDLAAEPQATTDATIVGATQTAEAITLTPGAPLTATADAQMLLEPVSINAAMSGAANVSGLPTFTPPPALAAATTPSTNTGGVGEDTTMIEAGSAPISEISLANLPRILPIVLLGGLGILGVLISMLRR